MKTLLWSAVLMLATNGCGVENESLDEGRQETTSDALGARKWLVLWAGTSGSAFAAMADGTELTCADGSRAFICPVASCNVASSIDESAADLLNEVSKEHPLMVSASTSKKTWLRVYAVKRGLTLARPIEESAEQAKNGFSQRCYALTQLATPAGASPDSPLDFNYQLKGLGGDSTSRWLTFVNADGLSPVLDSYGEAPAEFIASVNAALVGHRSIMACGEVLGSDTAPWFLASQLFK